MNLNKIKESLIVKLIDTYLKHHTLYIGCDFDDTLRDYKVGTPVEEVVDVVKKAIKQGLKICLYTVREDKELVYAIDWCIGMGIHVSHVNYSPLSPGTRKPHFNILLDDKAGLSESVDVLNEVLNQIKLINSNYEKKPIPGFTK